MVLGKFLKYLLYYTCILQLHSTYQGEDDIEEIDIGDDFDTSIFDTAGEKKDFITGSIGSAINGVSIVKENAWLLPKNTSYNTFTLNNLKTQKLKFFLNTISFFNFYIINYNVVLSEHVVFLVGIKCMSQNLYFSTNKEFLFKDIASRFGEDDSIKTIKINIEKKGMEGKQVSFDDGVDWWNLKDKKEFYTTNVKKFLKDYVSVLGLIHKGMCLSFAWYSNLQNLSKSWFIKAPLLCISFQNLSHLTMAQNENQDKHPNSSSNLRIRSFSFIGGFEVGYSHFSVEFFMNLAAILDNDLTYTEKFKENPQGKNLYSYGLIIKYNFF